jgi:serine/threonine protein kinase
MPQDLDGPREALADRYAIERELGAGGMATVYLAHDQKLNRSVALKVLKPELAAALGPERFLREIEIAAKLNHPHILPVFDSGQAEGPMSRAADEPAEPSAIGPRPSAIVLYYTMPYVEGESLRDRLTREKQLPLDDALQITREVADALGYAHSLGLVHRDIKPENILFQAGHALVADFGIAKAIAAAGSERLTETGLAIGTPAYMSPEQAAGNPDLDGRSDLYSLGCVLYEMLSGETPYTGPTPQAILAKKLSEPLPRISVVRDAVAPGVEAALTRVLARTPADRFATAQQFTAAIAADGATLARPVRGTARIRRLAIGGVALILAAVGVWAVALRPSPSDGADSHATPIDSTAIAVLPFQVVGADSASPARTLARFIGDLFELKVTGEFGRRIRHPGSVAERWREAGGTLDSALSEDRELAVARAVGAGRLVRGTVVTAGDSVVVSASMVDVTTGAVRVPAQRVEGTIARQQELVDRLIVLLLSRDAGVSAASAPRLAHYRPEAIQAYLAGLRAPTFSDEEHAFFRAALAADSSLVDAALMVVAAGERPSDTVELRYAWEHQEQLTERLRAYLQMLAAGRYGSIHTEAEKIAGYEMLARRWPEWRTTWGEIGGELTIWGALASVPDWRRRAGEAFGRMNRRSDAAWWHLTELAFMDGNTARARAAADSLIARAGGWLARYAPAYRWRLAILEGDTAEAGRVLAQLPDSSWVLGFACTDGRGLADADRVAARVTPPDDGFAAWWAWARGHEQAWRDALRRLSSGPGQSGELSQAAEPVFYALLLGSSGDSVAGDAVQSLARLAGGTRVPHADPDDQALARSWLALWRLRHGDTTGARATRRWLESDVARGHRFVGWARLIDVLLAEAQGGDVHAALGRMDSLVRDLPLPTGVQQWWPWPAEVQNLLLAQLWRRYGEPELGLAAVRRRPYHAVVLGYDSFPEYLREEGRLAAMVGDTAGAIEAYQHYLALREDPDHPWRAQWDSVRAELDRLLRAKG